MLTLTRSIADGPQSVAFSDWASVQMPKARRIKITPTRGGAVVSQGAREIKPITITGRTAAQKRAGIHAAPLRLDDLRQLQVWLDGGHAVSASYRRVVWGSTDPIEGGAPYSMPVETLGQVYVTEIDPTYSNPRFGTPALVDWRVVLTPLTAAGRVV